MEEAAKKISSPRDCSALGETEAGVRCYVIEATRVRGGTRGTPASFVPVETTRLRLARLGSEKRASVREARSPKPCGCEVEVAKGRARSFVCHAPEAGWVKTVAREGRCSRLR